MTIETPMQKFIVIGWPSRAADETPMQIVANADEYFFKIVSGKEKKKEREKKRHTRTPLLLSQAYLSNKTRHFTCKFIEE